MTGATLVAISKDGLEYLSTIGLTLAYSTCALMVIYYIAYLYYNKKYSGKK